MKILGPPIWFISYIIEGCRLRYMYILYSGCEAQEEKVICLYGWPDRKARQSRSEMNQQILKYTSMLIRSFCSVRIVFAGSSFLHYFTKTWIYIYILISYVKKFWFQPSNYVHISLQTSPSNITSLWFLHYWRDAWNPSIGKDTKGKFQGNGVIRLIPNRENWWWIPTHNSFWRKLWPQMW